MISLQGWTTLPCISISTTSIDSIPPASLFEAVFSSQARTASVATLEAVYTEVLRGTISQFEQTGSTVISDGEQAQPSFATDPLSGPAKIAVDGVIIPFADGNTRQVPRMTVGPFRYSAHAATYVWGCVALRNRQ